MKIRSCILPVIMMLNSGLLAQKNPAVSVGWKMSGTLPATDKKLLGFAGPVAGVSNNVFIAGGGSNFPDKMPWLGGAKNYYDSLYLYKKDINDSLIKFSSAKLPFSLAYAACVSTNKGIVIAGGENDNGISKKVLLIKWLVDKEKINIQYLPDLPLGVTMGNITSIGNIIYFAGGDAGKEVSNQFLCLNLDKQNDTWHRLPDISQPTTNAVLAAQHDGKAEYIYLIGGRKKNLSSPSDLYKTVFRFDFKKHIWQKMQSLHHVLSAGTGVAVGTNSILLFGGDPGETFHQTEELIFAIAREKNGKRKEELNQKKINVQSTHPGFSKKVLLYNTRMNEWKEIGEIPFPSPATTVAVKWGNEVFIPGGEIRAGVRTAQIISAKIILQ